MKWTLRIHHTRGDKITMLWATSRRPGHSDHRLDMEAYKLNGCCDCEDFTMNCEKLVRKELHLPTSQRTARRCDHLKAGREWLLNKFLQRLADPIDSKGAPHNSHH